MANYNDNCRKFIEQRRANGGQAGMARKMVNAPQLKQKALVETNEAENRENGNNINDRATAHAESSNLGGVASNADVLEPLIRDGGPQSSVQSKVPAVASKLPGKKE